MIDIEKLANDFERSVNEDVFGKMSYAEEANKLVMFAGKLRYKAEKTEGNVAQQLMSASKLILAAADILKKI
jgi:hypothetical protein